MISFLLAVAAVGFVFILPVAERARRDDYVRHAPPAFTQGKETTYEVKGVKWRRVDHFKAVP